MPAVELLQAYHDRKAFHCGRPVLDEFLQRHARKNADRNLGVTHVVVPADRHSRVLGYYTLVTRTVETAVIPAKGLPPRPIGVALLGRLAVELSCQRQGIGRLMLMRALRQTEEAARVLGIYALVLDAVDDSDREWYESLGWGFQALLDDPRHLFLPVAVIRKLGL